MNELFKINSKNANAYFRRAQALWKSKREQEAAEDIA